MTVNIKKKIYFGIFWIVLVSSFLFFASLLILVANGYHLNMKSYSLEKTGILILAGPTDALTVNLNGKERTGNLTFKYSQLFPGSYRVVAKKDGYNTWEKTYQINGGQAVVVNNLILFLSLPKITDMGSDIRTISNINNDHKNQSSNCVIKNNELWYNDSLVTRFSQPLVSAIYDSNIEHFYVQSGKEIRVLDKDGRNDILLIKLSDESPITMSTNNSILNYVDNSVLYSAKLWN